MTERPPLPRFRISEGLSIIGIVDKLYKDVGDFDHYGALRVFNAPPMPPKWLRGRVWESTSWRLTPLIGNSIMPHIVRPRRELFKNAATHQREKTNRRHVPAKGLASTEGMRAN